MRAEIYKGVLVINPETATEEYALSIWKEASVKKEYDIKLKEQEFYIGSKIIVVQHDKNRKN